MNNKDRILVVLGYHSEELEWGKIVEKQFNDRGLNKNRNITFFTIEDSPILTGLDSPYSNQRVFDEIKKLEDVYIIVDMHCHPFLGLGEEYKTDNHEPNIHTNNLNLQCRFKEVFPYSLVHDTGWRNSKMDYAIFDPDFWGPGSISTKEIYERSASETVDNLDKLCMVLENKDLTDIKSKYKKTVPYEDLNDAILWCKDKIRQSPESTSFFQNSLKLLMEGQVRYSISEPKGVHISLLTSFAKAYRDKYRDNI